MHEFGQGVAGMWGACWSQVAYDIGDSKHVRGMLAKVLNVLTILTILITNKKQNAILKTSKFEGGAKLGILKNNIWVTKLYGCSFQAPHCLIWT